MCARMGRLEGRRKEATGGKTQLELTVRESERKEEADCETTEA